MSTTAVTQDAPAVSESNSSFLPAGEKYRLTGELPESKEAVASQAEAADTSVEGKDSSTAAASEAADTQESKGPAKTKTAQASESRWAKLSRANRELQDQLRQERERNARASSEQRETQQASQTAAEDKSKGHPEPKIDDTDLKTGAPKYKTLSDYLADVRKWDREQSLKEFQELSAKTQREQQQLQTEQIIEKTVNERVQAARKAYPDYDEAAVEALAVKDNLGREALFYTKGSHLDGFFLDSERGHDVLYHIFKNFDECKHIFARDEKGNYLLNPVRQLRWLAKIENSLPEKGKATNSSAQRVTQAPRPPHQVSGKGTVAKDAIEQAVEENDTDAYIQEQNARALARLKKGK